MPGQNLIIERADLKQSEWFVDHEAHILIIATHLDDQQASAAEREAFSALQAVEQD